MIQMDKVKLDASQVIMQYPSENRREPGRQDLKAWSLSAEDSKSSCCFQSAALPGSCWPAASAQDSVNAHWEPTACQVRGRSPERMHGSIQESFRNHFYLFGLYGLLQTSIRKINFAP